MSKYSRVLADYSVILLVCALTTIALFQLPRRAETWSKPCTIERIIDGDTFTCEDHTRVRILELNAPEMNEPYIGSLSRISLVRLIPPGSHVLLYRRPGDDERDIYGRTLARVQLDLATHMQPEYNRLRRQFSTSPIN